MRRAVAAFAAVMALAGCGSHRSTPPAPPLPRALAHAWARQAEAIASALSASDPCTAHSLAAALQTQVVDAVNAHRVPARFQEPLVSGVNALVARSECGSRSQGSAAQRRARTFAAWLRRSSG